MVSMGFDPDRVGHRRQMNLRRMILLVGAVVLTVGVIGLLVGVSVPGPDNGSSIGCGNGVAADLSAAREADNNNPANLPILNQVIPHTNYVTQCQSALSESTGMDDSGGRRRPGGDRRVLLRRGPRRSADAVTASSLRARQPGSGAAAGPRRRQAGRSPVSTTESTRLTARSHRSRTLSPAASTSSAALSRYALTLTRTRSPARRNRRRNRSSTSTVT